MTTTNILLIVGLFCSCTKIIQEDSTIDKEEKDNNAKIEFAQKAVALEPKPTIDSVDNIKVLLQFDNLIMTTGYEEVWNDENYFAEVHKDKILVQLGLASKISGQTYLIKTESSIRSIEVFQNYETSLTIMNEGPHVDLTEWKHFVGEWKKLEIENNRFKTLEYSTADQEKFPPVTSAEILAATKKHLGIDSDRWIELAQQCSGPNAYPCGVSISRINLKVILTDSNGKTTEKYVILEIPMGC